MCPDRERRPFADAAPEAAGAAEISDRSGAGPAVTGAIRRRIGRPVAVAAIAAWTLLVAVYTLLFALSGYSIPLAIRAAFANGIPDGLLALAAFEASRRLDAPGARPRRLLLAHVPRAFVLVGLAFAAKAILLWIDVVLVRGEESFRLAVGIVAWQIFVSTLTYTAVAAASHAWLIARRLRVEEARTARAEALRARAELSALRAQLNPHFLFNVLHSVLGMVRRDPALAEAALEGLGDLLRYALRVHRDGVDRTALRHEWEFMETYLGLEKIRLGNRLQTFRRADEAALDHEVPTFSLQPLVENAVRHGIAPRAAGGKVSIEARIEGEALRLEVSDIGVDAGDAGGGGGGADATGEEGGIGLRVLRDRLDVLYGGRASMTAGRTAEGGYRVILMLPLEPEAPGAPQGEE